MSEQHGLQSRRFEFKYYIDHLLVRGIRDFLRPHLILDEHDDPDNPKGYPICSLYLDSSDFLLYSQTLRGQKNRFKLRMRFYDDDLSGPAFLEIKRRETDVIRKKRAAVTRKAALSVLKGGWPSPTMLYKQNGNMDALNQFCSLCRSIHAAGAAYVVYRREAYVSPTSNQVRVTFDSNLMGGIYQPGSELVFPKTGVRPKLPGVILELKFTDRFPLWMHDLVQIFNLERTSAPKYVQCVDSLELNRRGSKARQANVVR